jgi:hypothetical protein
MKLRKQKDKIKRNKKEREMKKKEGLNWKKKKESFNAHINDESVLTFPVFFSIVG